MTRHPAPHRLPIDIRRKLTAMLWRSRWFVLIRGMAVVTIALLTILLAAVGIDHFVMGYVERHVILYEWVVRLALTLAIVGTAVGVTIHAVVRPMVRRFTDSGIAQTIEEAHPELEERLSSTVELLVGDEPAVVRGSPAMIAILTRQAETDAQTLNLRGVIHWDRTVRYWAVAALLGLIVFVVAARWPGPFAASLRRLLLANLERVGHTEVVLLSETDRVVPEGEPVLIRAEVRGRAVRSAWLLLRGRSNRLDTVEMSPAQDGVGVFTCTVPKVTGAWQYQVRAGDGRTRWGSLTAVPRPRVTGVEATLHPPAYSGRPVKALPDLPDELKVLRHTRIELTVRTNKPVAQGALQFDADRSVELTGVSENRYTASFTVLEDVSLRVLLADAYGLDNLSPSRHRITVVRDEPPSVSILQPGKRVTLKASDKLPIRFAARDDLAVTKAELIVGVGMGEPIARPIDLPQPGQQTIEAQTVLDLSELGLANVRQVTYRIRVWDSLPTALDKGPQMAVSAPQEVMIDAAAQTFRMQVLQSVRKQFQTAMVRIGELLDASQKQTAKLKTAAGNKQAYAPEQIAETDTVRQALRKAEELTNEIGELTTYTDYRLLGQALQNDVSKAHIIPAEQLLAQGRLLETEHAERADRFARAEFEIQRAQAQLTRLAKQFDDSAVYQEAAQALADAAVRQAELAERISRLSSLQSQPTSMPKAGFPTSSQAGEIPHPPEAHPTEPGRISVASRPADTASTSAPADLAHLTKEQQELIRATRDLIAAHPQMLQPALQLHQTRGKTLLEQIADLIARQGELTKIVQNQQDRDKLKTRREELAKAQSDLGNRVAQLVKERGALLAQAGVRPPDVERMAAAAGKVLQEHLREAVELQGQSAAELADISRAAGVAAKKIAASAPNPQPHQQLAGATKDLVGQVTGLAQQQRQLTAETTQVLRQRDAQHKALSEADDGLQQQSIGLAKRQEALGAQVESLVGKINESPPIASALKALLGKLKLSTTTRHAVQQFSGRPTEPPEVSQQVLTAKLDELGKGVAEQAAKVRQEQKRFAGEMDKWNAAEAQRAKALADYQAEMARREQAVAKWQTDEAARKAALEAWRSVQQARLKPVPATQTAVSQASTQPVTTQAIAQATTGPAPVLTEPPKELTTPIPPPAFPALANPPDKPAPKPEPAGPLWDEGLLKLADAIAAEAAALAKQQQELHGQTAALTKATKELAERRTAASKQIDQEDGALHNRQHDLYQTAARVITQAGKLAPETGKLTETAHAGRSMQEAAGAIKKHDLPAAVKVQERAAAELDALAKALLGESDRATAAANAATTAAADARQQAAAQQQLAELITQLHQQQAQLRAQAIDVGRQLTPLGPTPSERILSDLLRRQQELAKEAGELSDELARPQQAVGTEVPAQPDPTAQTAAMEVQKASQGLQDMAARGPVGGSSPHPPSSATTSPVAASASGPSFEGVTSLQRTAANRLEQLARKLQQPVELDPAQWEQQATEQYVRIQQAERAAELAARQRRLTRQIEDLAAGKPLQAIGLEQRALRDQAADFALAAEFLKEQVETVAPKTPLLKSDILANATKAVELLKQTAPVVMDRAARELGQDKSDAALPPMTEAQKVLGEAHRLLGTLQGQLAKAAGQTPAPSPTDEELSKQLTQTLQDQYEALRAMLEAQHIAAEGPLDPAQAAAQAWQADLAARAARAAANANAARMQAGAREFLEAAWQAAGQKDIDPNKIVVLPGVPTGAGNWQLVIPDSRILDLEMIGLSRSDWARLPGVLREEVIQAAEDKSPPEYRDLIRRYFKAISQRAGARGDRPVLDDTRVGAPPTPTENKAGQPK